MTTPFMLSTMGAIGIFGGSFDPIHFGHINLALEVMEKCELKEVWFVPAHISPHKLKSPPVDQKHRLEMLKLAIDGIDGFKIVDIELKRPQPSYTVDTIHYFLEHYPKCQFHLITGNDALESFHKWYKFKEILSLVPLIVGRRKLGEFSSSDPIVRQAFAKTACQTSLLEVSSTQVRDRIKKNLPCLHLLPQKVVDYIHENKLYSCHLK